MATDPKILDYQKTYRTMNSELLEARRKTPKNSTYMALLVKNDAAKRRYQTWKKCENMFD